MSQQHVMTKLQSAAQSFQTGDFARTLSLSDEALSLMPGHPEGLHLKALSLGRLGRIDEAIPLFDGAAAVHPMAHAILANKGNALKSAERFDEAGAAYRAALSRKSDFGPALQGLAELLRLTGDHDGALQVLKDAAARLPGEAGLMNDLGNILVLKERYRDAAEAFTSALRLQPQMVNALVNRGAAWRRLAMTDDAIRDHERAVSLAPRHAEALYQLASTYLKAGDAQKAEARFLDALAIEPRRLDIHRDLARFLWEQGHRERYLGALDQSISATGDDALCALKAELAYQSGDIVGAEQAACGALAKNPKNALARRFLGRIQRERGDKAGIETLKKVVESDSDDYAARIDLATALIGEGQAEAALRVLEAEVPLKQLQAQTALKTTAMRILGDSRYRDFYDYDRFTRQMTLAPPQGYDSIDIFNAELYHAITRLHHTTTQPIDQTLYGGTQSVGRLWDEPVAVIAAMKDQLLAAAADFVRSLPDDDKHPFLKRKSAELECAGAWSVILKDGGGHVDHFHPEGWISAVYYVAVPDEIGAQTNHNSREGYLRLGQPAIKGVDLAPEHWVRPRAGTVVFFPSYMWHGVEPFSAAQPRVTAPFDLRPAK